MVPADSPVYLSLCAGALNLFLMVVEMKGMLVDSWQVRIGPVGSVDGEMVARLRNQLRGCAKFASDDQLCQ